MKTLRNLAATASLAMASAAIAAPVHMPGQLGALPMLLSTDVAVADLTLTPAQQASINKLRTDFRSSARAIVAEAGKNPAAQAAAQSKLDDLRSVTNRRVLALLTPAQKAGLARLEYNYLGAGLLFLPDVQSALGLDPSQKERIAALGSEWAAAVQSINTRFDRGEISPHKRRALLRADRESRNRELLGILNSKQKDAFHAMGHLTKI
jgi:Spy/CpxP family protein refolding chaperone